MDDIWLWGTYRGNVQVFTEVCSCCSLYLLFDLCPRNPHQRWDKGSHNFLRTCSILGDPGMGNFSFLEAKSNSASNLPEPPTVICPLPVLSTDNLPTSLAHFLYPPARDLPFKRGWVSVLRNHWLISCIGKKLGVLILKKRLKCWQWWCFSYICIFSLGTEGGLKARPMPTMYKF